MGVTFGWVLQAALCLQPTKFDLPRTAASHTQSGSGAVIQYTRPVHKLLQLTDRNATSTDSGHNNCYRDAQPQMATRCFQSASAQMSCLVLSRLAGCCCTAEVIACLQAVAWLLAMSHPMLHEAWDVSSLWTLDIDLWNHT